MNDYLSNMNVQPADQKFNYLYQKGLEDLLRKQQLDRVEKKTSPIKSPILDTEGFNKKHNIKSKQAYNNPAENNVIRQVLYDQISQKESNQHKPNLITKDWNTRNNIKAKFEQPKQMNKSQTDILLEQQRQLQKETEEMKDRPILMTDQFNRRRNIRPKQKMIKRNQSERQMRLMEVIENDEREKNYHLFHKIENYTIKNDNIIPRYHKTRTSTPDQGYKPEINEISKMVVKAKQSNKSFMERSKQQRNRSLIRESKNRREFIKARDNSMQLEKRHRNRSFDSKLNKRGGFRYCQHKTDLDKHVNQFESKNDFNDRTSTNFETKQPFKLDTQISSYQPKLSKHLLVKNLKINIDENENKSKPMLKNQLKPKKSYFASNQINLDKDQSGPQPNPQSSTCLKAKSGKSEFFSPEKKSKTLDLENEPETKPHFKEVHSSSYNIIKDSSQQEANIEKITNDELIEIVNNSSSKSINRSSLLCRSDIIPLGEQSFNLDDYDHLFKTNQTDQNHKDNVIVQRSKPKKIEKENSNNDTFNSKKLKNKIQMSSKGQNSKGINKQTNNNSSSNQSNNSKTKFEFSKDAVKLIKEFKIEKSNMSSEQIKNKQGVIKNKVSIQDNESNMAQESKMSGKLSEMNDLIASLRSHDSTLEELLGDAHFSHKRVSQNFFEHDKNVEIFVNNLSKLRDLNQ